MEGSAASEYWDDKTVHAIAMNTFKSDKLLCAIRIALVTLAKAEVFKGRKATVWSSEKDKLVKSYTGRNVEIDGNIITAHGLKSA